MSPSPSGVGRGGGWGGVQWVQEEKQEILKKEKKGIGDVVSLICGDHKSTSSCGVLQRVLHTTLSCGSEFFFENLPTCGSESLLQARAFHFLPFFWGKNLLGY